MTRTRKLLALVLVVATAAGVATTLRAPPRGASTTATRAAAGHRLELTNLVRRAVVDAAQPPAARPPAVRAEAWLAAHPPSPALREALLDVAARAARVAQPLPSAADGDDAAARAVAVARQARDEEQEAFRVQLRAALRVMTAAERAALRAAHVNVIQLARHVASTPG